MSRRFLTLLAVAVAAVASASPALAATQGCKSTTPPCVAAECVYIQQVPTSGTCKKKPAAHHKTTPSVQHITTTVQHPTWVQTPKQPTVKKPQHPSAKHSQQHPKQQTKVTKPPPHPVPVIPVAASVKQPSAVSAAFDLGFGPTALFAALLAAAALLAVGGGLRHGRRR